MDFETALKPIWENLARYSRALAGSREAGDDLLQNALLRAWKAYSRLKQTDSFQAWLFAIIRNTHRSNMRLQWFKRLAHLDEAANIPACDPLSYDEKEVVRLALRTLPLEQREALILFEVLGMSAAETAAIQKITLSAVKSRLARGRERLLKAYLKLSELPEIPLPNHPSKALAAISQGENDAV